MQQTDFKTETISSNGFQYISEKEDRLINEEICRLLPLSFNHSEFRKAILHSPALKMISANAPSTIFSVRRSYNVAKNNQPSEKDFEFHHFKLPADPRFAEAVRKDLENHIISVNSLIEADFHRKFPATGVTNLRGLYDLTQLLNHKSLRQIALSLLKTIEIKDVIFGWMRCNLNEVWIIALRRFADQPKFNNRDYALLKVFTSRLYDFRGAWNQQDVGQKYVDVLTSREQEAIYHFVGGLKDKETAAQMKISKRTLDTHWQNIFNKMGVGDKILVLDKLGMITNKIPLENEKAINNLKTEALNY